MYIKDGKVGSNHSDQSQVCQLHCFVTTKPNAPHMRGTPPQTDAGSPRHHRQQSGPRGATSPARGKLRTRIVWSPREVRRFRIDRLRLHGRYGRCGSGRDHQRYSLAASNLAIGTPTPDGSSETSEDSLGDQTACEDVAPPRGTRRKHQRPQRPAVSRARRTLHCSPAGAARISRMHSVTAHGKAHSPARRQCNKHRASHLKRGSPAPFKEQIPRQETTP